jgi:hypothetical protein
MLGLFAQSKVFEIASYASKRSFVSKNHHAWRKSTITKRYNLIMADNIPEAFQNGTLYSDQEIYKFLKLPTAASSSILQAMSKLPTKQDNNNQAAVFQAFMVDKDEITVMLPSFHFDELQKDIADIEYEVGPISYRIITFDVVLAPTLVGFMAVVTRTLADANISVLPFAAYSRDHIFVSEADFDRALLVLNRLKDSTTASK